MSVSRPAWGRLPTCRAVGSGGNRCSLALLLLGVPLWAGCDTAASAPVSADAPADESAVRVEVIHPQRKTIRQVVEEPAQLKPYEETPLYAKLSGYVRKVDVDLGDHVRGPQLDAQGRVIAPGQELAALWVPEIEDDVRQKTAGVASAQAEVQQARAAIRVAEATVATAQAGIEQATAAIQRAEADYRRWQSESGRVETLAAQAAVTRKLADESQSQLAAADAERLEAQARRALADAAVAHAQAQLEKARADLVAAEARAAVAQADCDRAVTMREYATLRAPFDGVVTRRNVHTGHLVQPGIQGEPLLIVTRVDVLRVAIDIPETSAGLTAAAAEVSLRIPALGQTALSLHLARVDGALDPATRTLRTEADLPNPEGKFRPGLYALASVVVGEHRDALVLPASAILAEKTDSFCGLVQDGRLVRKRVVLGLRDPSGDVEIVEGLSAEDQVLRVNTTALSAGQSVQPVPVAAP